MRFSPESLRTMRVADVMLATPKTLPSDVTVGEARSALANPHTEMLLLTEGAEFRGAITAIPENAEPGTPALEHADKQPETIGVSESAESAYRRTVDNPHRRIVVLDGGGSLLGLVCLDRTLTSFCTGGPS